MSQETKPCFAIRNRPYPGEYASGDCPFIFMEETKVLMGLADVLGHGSKAHEVSQQIESQVEEVRHLSIEGILNHLNNFLAERLGAAVGIATLDLSSGDLAYAAVGNIRAYVLGTEDYAFVSHDGVIGMQYRKPVLQERTLDKGDKFVMTSDGVQERFYTHRQEHFLSDDLGELSTFIVERFGKNHDDVSCLVVEY